jgi:uroporphyrinogen-III decarboxylase
MNPIQERYRQRLSRYTAAMAGRQPDRVPIRPFVAEWTAEYAGFTCQQTAHDYPKALEAALRCAADFDWDAVVPNMIATWTGMLQAFGLKYYAIPGIDLPANVGHQYREPPEADAFMRADEYDALIADPTGFLFEVWLPRVAGPVVPPGQPATAAHSLALVKGTMAMNQFFQDLGQQSARLRDETGTVSAIAGMVRAPLDMLADKLRGYLGLVDDLHQQPEKVLAACEALLPHLTKFALLTADPMRQVPLGFWMHRGCVPFINYEQFGRIFWPTLRPLVEELWAHGHQTLFYAEGDWEPHLATFAELPERSIVFHLDRTDPQAARRALGDRFCLSGGLPNTLLSRGTPEEVRRRCKELIDSIGRDGGYIMDASAIVQNDAKTENIRAMTEAVHEFGVYGQGHGEEPEIDPPAPKPSEATPGRFVALDEGQRRPGVCVPWEEAREAIGTIRGDEAICRDVWQQVDTLGYFWMWCVFLVF